MGNLQLNSHMIQQNLAEEQTTLKKERNHVIVLFFVPLLVSYSPARCSCATRLSTCKGVMEWQVSDGHIIRNDQETAIKIFLSINPESEARIFY